MFMCLLLEYFSLASIFWHIYTQFWVVELNAPKNERSCGNEWKKKCQIICIYELWLFLDCSGCSNHHFDYLFQWQHKWFTLLQPFPYIFIHFCLFCFCFCFYFYFLYMRVFMPICRSFVHPLIPISLSPRKKTSCFCVHTIAPMTTAFVRQNSKTIRTHTNSVSHIFMGWIRNGWMLFFFVVIVVFFFFIFSPNDKLFVLHHICMRAYLSACIVWLNTCGVRQSQRKLHTNYCNRTRCEWFAASISRKTLLQSDGRRDSSPVSNDSGPTHIHIHIVVSFFANVITLTHTLVHI